ncbi:pilus assembly protein [Tessaracoccus sp. OS52]|uniref:TadE/TadG family type IV pilus assembly protein n=1 Tax=Tessaracoccus sp. OS52 TaxID=2886691 RepID=UPI001D105AF4|nr:TadE/TadG family type IV pilus assembly protein [Tessaracoccus sp. OS52]MCC2592872.1 pilus assembly protein [Tessaracoccus sp. OS52]
MSRRLNERGGAVAVEAAVLVPALVLFVGLVVLMARVALADQAVSAAAVQAARAASLERNVTDARSAARSTAVGALEDADLQCGDESVQVDAAGVQAPLGQPSTVAVTITCTVPGELSFPGFPSSRTIVATRQSPVDTYRGR